jgi:hypothetical protein
MMMSISQTAALNGRMICEYCMEKDLEGIGHGLLEAPPWDL